MGSWRCRSARRLGSMRGAADRRSCNRTPSSPARRQTVDQGFLRSARGWSRRAPLMTNEPPRGCACRISRAGRFNTIVFRPVFESGSSRRPRPKSTCSQRRSKISRSLAPVKIRRRSAAAASGESNVRWFSSFVRCFDFGASPSSRHAMPTVSPSRMAAPSRSSSSGDRKRSRRSSGNFSIFLAGLRLSGTSSLSDLNGGRSFERDWRRLGL